ncbi:hypothetical protein ISN45_At02g021950 [Arabidopsis thaliana x Arabidopsis arenosa]|uniref:Nucleoplasmin-like domain-containing protein n=1 Tax=Arabidopsis thaliana x Arabidopsis arenosa TaxID=1240361 RepID=A0A8T2G2X1_9BRAS|nr:hypothetical protein ISN45_At02g021950 [Arabidopsis thaliana x Arabidopsis arenosa]
MEFWGIEIKPGKPFKVIQKDGFMVHASQVTLGDVEKVKKDENFAVYVKIGGDENGFMIGNLSQKFPQFSIDLYLGHEFEISHNSTSSVYLIGYRTFDAFDELDEEIDSDSELDEYMEQQIAALPQNEINPEEDDESDSDEMGLDEDDDSSDEEDVEAEVPLKVAPPSKKMPNGAFEIAKGGKKNKSSGGKKRCPFPCGPSCKK